MTKDLLFSTIAVARSLCEILATKPLTAGEMLDITQATETFTKLETALKEMKTAKAEPLPKVLVDLEQQLLDANKLLLQIHREAYAAYQDPANGGVGVGIYRRFWQSAEEYIKKHMPERIIAKSSVLGMPYGSEQGSEGAVQS